MTFEFLELALLFEILLKIFVSFILYLVNGGVISKLNTHAMIAA